MCTSPFPLRAALWMSLAVLHMPLGGCKSRETKEQERACNEAIRDGRLDVKNANIEGARAKVAIADTTCPPLRKPYVDQLRDELREKEAAIHQEAERSAAEALRRREQPMVPFMEWVRTRSATEATTGEARCHDRGDPQFGWCDTSHAVVEGTEFHSRFWAKEPRAVRFSVTVRSPIVCEDLGEHRVVRSWNVTDGSAGTTRRTHCDLVSKSHRGLAALVSVTGEHSHVDVFSQGYLKQDAAFAEMLRREGR